MLNHERIATAAIEWTESERLAKLRKNERAALQCEYEDYQTNVQPCWKRLVENPDWVQDSVALIPDPDWPWCPKCLQRTKAHQAYREARAAAGVANRRLQALCRAAMKGGA